MFDHVTIRVADRDASRRFWEALAPSARLHVGAERPGRVLFRREGGGGGSLSIVQAAPGEPVTSGAQIAFGVEDGAAATMLDPDGNAIELVSHPR
ncbi:hypothetical protein Q5424_07360 [Conexibacter sp. JD483]|uniref:VOC family protein n=1 Tax=unclassified Conexibacter TaxID=2627773 RepID=UPI00271B93FE|nr:MULTISPECIES: hypothetical protein [unclassified Conexibacter]MDO8187137.1 hypothetical protein [Conexibacter sp. CPCC 205706]MDO8200313.1 hypothetical protein [Conexibacter sp. CPCC 205762]MDR9368891.1 hypothetical protein [Conexibacter sp. JD483]